MLSQRKVLVLNKCWQAINVITLERALNKVFSEYKDGTPKARIIDCVHDFQSMTWSDWSQIKPADGEEGMRSMNAIFRIPEVIQMTRFDKLPRAKVNYNRRTIYRRDNNTCQFCGKQKPSTELSLDHVIPRCQGGQTTWENIVVSCTKCNFKKAGRTPKEANMKLLRQPKKPDYNFFVGDVRIQSWKNFISAAYWQVELENDNK